MRKYGLISMLVLVMVGNEPAVGQGWLDRLLGREPATQNELGSDVIGDGLKEALEVGTERVVDALGKPDGFNADPLVRIPLPDSLQTVRSTLSRVGMSGTLDDLEIQLNRAAEAATPEAKALFIDAIRALTIDVRSAALRGDDSMCTG